MFTYEWRSAPTGFKILFFLSQAIYFGGAYYLGIFLPLVPGLFAIGVGFWTVSILDTIPKPYHEIKKNPAPISLSDEYEKRKDLCFFAIIFTVFDMAIFLIVGYISQFV